MRGRPNTRVTSRKVGRFTRPPPPRLAQSPALSYWATQEKTVQVQTHMELGGGLAPTVLRPVDAGGYQRARARVHHMNDATETPS